MATVCFKLKSSKLIVKNDDIAFKTSSLGGSVLRLRGIGLGDVPVSFIAVNYSSADY